MASELYNRLAKRLSLTPTALVPPAFACLFQAFRYLLLYGGRGGAKSWSIVRALLVLAYEAKLRILICRETMVSIQASAWQLLKDQIELLGLGEHYTVQADRIIGRNGSELFFEGLSGNSQKIKSYESIDILWCEEAQTISAESWEILRPTLRKPGSRIIVSWNPLTRHDPVMAFVTNPLPRSIIKKVGFEDNPHLSAEAHEERLWLQRVDPDLYRHVWGGEPREVSDALILKGKYVVEPFEVSAAWSGPFFGLDYGFGADPCAAVECYIDDGERVLYVRREYWALHIDIDALPQQLEMAIPGISNAVVQADSSRPETTSFLQRNGIPGARSAAKWSGSVDDGILFLRSFGRIVLDPSCKHTLDEMQTYSFRLDPRTNLPVAKPIDANNHAIDSLRYSLSELIRNQPTGGYFSRAALLVNGEPLDPPAAAGRPRRVFITMAITERSGTGIGAVTWLYSPHHGWPLVLVDYDLIEIEQLNAEWLRGLYARAQELRGAWDCLEPVTRAWIEEGGGQLYEAVEMLLVEELLPFDPACRPGGTPLTDLARVDPRQLINAQKLPLATLDARTETLRTEVNSGRLVKFARSAYTRQVTHRSDSANHLVTQLLGYRPNARDTAQELTAAFTLGCLLTRLEGRTPLSAPESQAPAGVPINRPPPLAPSDWLWQTATGCWREGPVPADHKGAVARRGDLGF